MPHNARWFRSTFPLLALCLLSPARADDWRCKEQASERRGRTIFVCGVAKADNEADSRIGALKNAQREFDELCSHSADCQGHDYTINPLRNDCAPPDAGNTVTCYRAFEFNVQDRLDPDMALKRQAAMLDEEQAFLRKRLELVEANRKRQAEVQRLKEQIEKPTPPPEEKYGPSAWDSFWEPPTSNEWSAGLRWGYAGELAGRVNSQMYFGGSVDFWFAKPLSLKVGFDYGLLAPDYTNGASLLRFSLPIHVSQKVLFDPEYFRFKKDSSSAGGFGFAIIYRAINPNPTWWDFRIGFLKMGELQVVSYSSGSTASPGETAVYGDLTFFFGL